MSRGPARVSAELNEARGNPGHRNRPVASADRYRALGFDAPQVLEGMAREIWDVIVGLLSETRILRETDKGELAAFCEDSAEFWLATEMLHSEGMVHVNPKTGVTRLNPWHKVKDSARRRMIAGADRLGLTPTARSRVLEGMVKSEPPGDQKPDCRPSDEVEELLKFIGPDLRRSKTVRSTNGTAVACALARPSETLREQKA